MKKFFLIGIKKTISLLILTVIFNLSLLTHSSAQDLLKYIPAKASGVLAFNGEGFFKKVDLNQITNLEMFRDLDAEAKQKKDKEYEEMSKAWNAPESIGLNKNSQIYFFFENNYDTTFQSMSHYFGCLFSLTKAKKFESFLKKLTKDEYRVQKKGSWKYLSEKGFLLAWSSNAAIVLGMEGGGKENQLVLQKFESMISQTEAQSIKSNKNFSTLHEKEYDFNYWMNFHSLFSGLGIFKQFKEPFLQKIPFYNDDFYKDYYLSLILNFHNGNISWTTQQTLNSESAKKVKPFYGDGINPELVRYIHRDHLLGVYTYSSDMKGIKAILDTALHDTLKQKVNEGFIELLYESKVRNDKRIKKLQAEIDSMYTDLYSYNNTNYDTYNYSDTASYYENYSDTTYKDYVPDTTSSAPPEPDYNYNTYTDTAVTAVDTTYNYDSYNYERDEKADSIYNAKYERINKKYDNIKAIKTELYRAKAKELNLKSDDLFNLFEGDFLAACTDILYKETKYKTYVYDEEELKSEEVEKTKKDPYPEFVVALTLNDVAKAKDLMKKMERDSFIIAEENFYKAPGEVEGYMGIQEKILIITNKKELLRSNFNGYSP
ncbi:MAG: DUF4836 family protein, partial [Cytophagaceae bacterium]|nr:DUF4836 family protein [Cytophagaceae bacterium]